MIESFKEFTEEQRILKILSKPEPNFNCLSISDDDIYKWYNSYLKFKDDFILYELYDEDYLSYKNGALFEKKYDILPDEKFAEQIRKKYHFTENQFRLEEYNNGVGIYVALPNIDTLISKLDLDMRRNNYFLSNELKEDNKIVKLLFEPLKQANINKLISERDYIYHYTNHKNVKSILKKGLIPNNHNDVYHYPPRVYFTLFENHRLANNLLKNLIQNNKDVDNHYMMLKIDTSRIKYANFYFDAFCKNCVFTPDYILPHAISKYIEGYLTGGDKFEIIKEY